HAQRPSAKVADEQRSAEQRDVSHEQGFFDLKSPGVRRGPEVVHHHRHWNQEEREQRRAKACPVAKEHAQSPSQRNDASERYQEASQRYPMVCGVFNGGRLEVACRRQYEDDRKQLPSEKTHKIRVLHHLGNETATRRELFLGIKRNG